MVGGGKGRKGDPIFSYFLTNFSKRSVDIGVERGRGKGEVPLTELPEDIKRKY